ncbi:unnamed protein product [Lactuca virosa]|uniref:Uncharacterized protein n=1 Tax=Lactuca virosa TaxID=75947 RepID=A0AAU9M618_9ASTR|nr:unnamed protein product [Lactuca virosa]
MARLKGRRGVRNKKIRISTDADEGLQKIDNSSHDLNVEAFDVHEGEIFSADASGETVNRSCTQDDAQMIVDFFKSIEVDDDDGGIEMEKEVSTFAPSLDDLLSHPSFENPYFVSGAGDKDDHDVKSEDMNGSYGFVGQGIRIRSRTSSSGFNGVPQSVGFNGFPQSSAPKRIRMLHKISKSSCVGEDSKNQEFGRDTNRLDYFSVAAFDVYGDDHLTGVASYGGGGGRRDRGIVLAPGPEEERGGATDVAGEAVVQRLEQERGDGGDSGGRRVRRLMVGMRLEQERGSATAGAGGGDRTREIPGGIFGNNGSGVDDDGDGDNDGIGDGEKGGLVVGRRWESVVDLVENSLR